jgi:hypothetical protein
MCFPLHPFRIEREWEAFGLKCVVTQNREAQARCGYVRIPQGTPDWGLDYNDIDVDVHGGLTFGDMEPCIEPDGRGHWVGFDCNHYCDAMYDPSIDASQISDPAIRIPMLIHRQTFHSEAHFWSYDEVVAETERLASQLALKCFGENVEKKS